MKITLIIVGLLMIENSVAQNVVYPLHVGDRWIFHSAGQYAYNRRVTGETTMPNGKKYSAILYVYLLGPSDVEFLRKDSNKVFRYIGGADSEAIIYDFARAVGDTIYSEPVSLDTIDHILEEHGIDTLFGKTLRYWVFGSYHRHAFDADYSITVFDSIGEVKIWSAASNSVLEGAIIDGVSYGAIAAINEDANEYPDAFKLKQNYPNPFNPSTTIRYELPERSNVSLKVFNLLGQEVATLTNEVQDAGEKIVTFNGTNLTSGVYFYKLEATSASDPKKSFVQSRKLVLMK